MIGMLVFLVPAAWLAYVVGLVLREGLAAVLYYRLADVTPWLMDRWDGLVWWALGLGLLGNVLVRARIHDGRWVWTLVAYPFVVVGGGLWLVACMLRPEWVLAPLGGLAVFAGMLALPFAATMAHFAMGQDELVKVLGWMLAITLLVAAVHGAVIWLL